MNVSVNLPQHFKHIQMKKLLPILITLLFPALSFAQADSISYGPGYTNQVWYNFTNGEVKSADNTSWDLSFGIGGFNTDIRINDGFGAELYLYPNGDTSAWGSVDTNGLQNWTPRFNSDTSWNVTAFADANVTHPDYGWGIYNSITHNVEGDSIYIIKLTDGSFKQLKMDVMASTGDFTFTYADIGGSNPVQGLINKPTYSTKKNVYYSLSADSIMDLEPAKTDWDILFTKYNQMQPTGGYYKVTGVLANADRSNAEARGVDLTTVSWWRQDYQSNIGVIGSDWKQFNMATFKYDVVDSLTYFFVDSNEYVWQLTFTGFAGSSTGVTTFNKAQVGVLSIENNTNQISSVNVFPNPAISQVNIAIEGKEAQNLDITIFSITGQQVYANTHAVTGSETIQVPVSNWKQGMYLIRLGNDKNAVIKQLIIQ